MSGYSRLPAASRHRADNTESVTKGLGADMKRSSDLKPNVSNIQSTSRRSLLPQFSYKNPESVRGDSGLKRRAGEVKGVKAPIAAAGGIITSAQTTLGEADTGSRTCTTQSDQEDEIAPVKRKPNDCEVTDDGQHHLSHNSGGSHRTYIARDRLNSGATVVDGSSTGKGLTSRVSSIKRNSSTKSRPAVDLSTAQSRTAGANGSVSRTHVRTDTRSKPTANSTAKRTSKLMEPPRIEAGPKAQTVNRRLQSPPGSPSKAQDATRLRGQMLPPPRATSNTYQQHYSPVNSSLPKPPVPIRRSSQVQSETETDTPISTDVLLQQIELLQLSLLHQTSTETLLEYESSAFGELAQRHASLRKRHENLKDIESKQRKLRNIEALNAWCNDQSQFNESLAILCRVIQELCVLSESNSKFDEVVLVFSEWIGQSDSSDALLPLQQDWRASHASLALKLRSLQRLLQNLPPVPSDAKGTSLWRLSRCCSVHVDGMLRELDVLGRLERQMLKSHKARLDREIERYILTEPPSATQTPNDGSWIPMWETDGDP